MSGVSAPGGDDVWAIGGTITNSDKSFPVLRHWDGRRWKSVKLPASFEGFPFEPYQVAASSAADVWAFTSSGEPKTGPPAGRWAHWNGDSWTTGALPVIKVAGDASPAVTITAASAAGKDDVWVGGTVSDWETKSTLPAASFLANYDGHAWRIYRVPESLPNVAGISVLNPTDIWVAASGDEGASGVVDAQGGNILLHWNGSSWQSIAVPKKVFVAAVTGESAHSAWVVGYVPGKGPDHQTYVAGAAHWNGSNWTITQNPAADAQFLKTDYIDELTSVVPDGRGGLWAVGEPYPPILASLPGPASLWHYANGRWTGARLGALGDMDLFQLAKAPGTNQIWAAGTAVRASLPGYPQDGSILQYQG
jgi:hypothetical protein